MLNASRVLDNQKRLVLSHAKPIRSWASLLLPAALVVAWFLVIAGIPNYLPTQLASWLTFVALLITPGYFLADIITWRMDIDWLERLALAFPLGVAVLAVPGILALLLHMTISQLTAAWVMATALVLVVWLVHFIWLRLLTRMLVNDRRQAQHVRRAPVGHHA